MPTAENGWKRSHRRNAMERDREKPEGSKALREARRRATQLYLLLCCAFAYSWVIGFYCEGVRCISFASLHLTVVNGATAETVNGPYYPDIAEAKATTSINQPFSLFRDETAVPQQAAGAVEK